MRSKRKNYFLGLISLCLVAYHSSAEPLLQCVTESGFQEIGRNNNGIKAYVVERGQRGVYGRWYTIHDYDKTPKIGKRELINKNDAFAGTLTSMTILKDVGSHLNLTIQDRMNLRVIHSIHGTIFNPTTNDFTKFNLEHFGISKFADNSVHFFSWIYNGLDEEGKQT